MVTLSLNLDDEIRECLTIAAAENEITEMELVGQFVEDGLTEMENLKVLDVSPDLFKNAIDQMEILDKIVAFMESGCGDLCVKGGELIHEHNDWLSRARALGEKIDKKLAESTNTE
jgi:hypothetical protein